MYDTLYRLALEVIVTMQVVIIKKCSSVQKCTPEIGEESANNTVYLKKPASNTELAPFQSRGERTRMRFVVMCLIYATLTTEEVTIVNEVCSCYFVSVKISLTCLACPKANR